jgi:hypothetical protein
LYIHIHIKIYSSVNKINLNYVFWNKVWCPYDSDLQQKRYWKLKLRCLFFITNFCRNTVPKYCKRCKISWRWWKWIFHMQILCWILIHRDMSKQQNRLLSRPLTFGLASACGRLWNWRVQCPSVTIKPVTEIVPLIRKGFRKKRLKFIKWSSTTWLFP